MKNEEEIKILAMPSSAVISADSIKLLRSKGVVIVRCDEPEKVQLLNPSPAVSALPANEFLWSAVQALSRDYPGYGDDMPKARKQFTENLLSKVTAKLPKPERDAEKFADKD